MHGRLACHVSRWVKLAFSSSASWQCFEGGLVCLQRHNIGACACNTMGWLPPGRDHRLHRHGLHPLLRTPASLVVTYMYSYTLFFPSADDLIESKVWQSICCYCVQDKKCEVKAVEQCTVLLLLLLLCIAIPDATEAVYFFSRI